MSDDFQYYGFYGRKGNTDDINKRASRQKRSINPQVNNKEFGVYVHTANSEIIEHLKQKYYDTNKDGEHYRDVPNLTFMPIEELLDEEITKIQNLINISYSYYHVDEVDKQISWAKVHALGREYMHSGYNSNLSKTIIDLIAKDAKKIKNDDKFDDNEKQNLNIQSQRTCESLHKIDHLNKEETHDYNKIILEDYIFKKGEKQLILGFGGNNDIKQYKKNPYAFNDPWLSRTTNLGFFVWNIMINKATIKCILDNSKTLFPMQIILSTNPNYLLSEQIDINSKNIKYIGYFIARIKLDELDRPSIVDPECKRLYDYKFDKIPESKEQYFVIFVFKNSDKDVKYDFDRYILTDFRLQRIHWGNLTRSKRVLLIEIQQLMCSYFKEEGNNKIYFYLLSEYETGTNEPVNKICKSQKEEVDEEENDKIKNKDCYQAWLDKDTIKKFNKHKIILTGDSYKIFVAKKDLNEIYDELVIRNEEAIEKEDISFNIPHNDPTFKRLIITEKITEEIDESVKVSVKEYILLPCHFKWEKKDKKNTFVLKHGDLNWDEYNLGRKVDCLEGDCIFFRDYIINTYKNIITYKNNLSIFPNNYLEMIKSSELSQYINLNKVEQQLLEQSESNINEQQGGYQTSNITKLDLYDSKYTCTFLEKQLFLLHLNCLTKIYLHENKNLDNFYIYYDDILPADDNEYYGYYQEILKNMFKQITWTNTNKHDKSKECIFISNNLDMYHKIKPKYALMDFKPDTDNNFFDGEILYTLYPFSNTDFKNLVKEYNKIKKYSDNIFQELLDNNKFFNLCYNYDIYNINKVIPIKYLKLIPGYTDNFECILEYKILYNYFYCIHNITDHTIIMNKLFDITIDNENNIKYWINCTLNKFKNAENETDIMFKNIVKLNIEQHAKHQIHLLNDYGSEVLDKQKISKAIKILEKYASDRVYIQIL
jgi:hypothetical protein